LFLIAPIISYVAIGDNTDCGGNENVIARYEAILLVAGRFLRKKKKTTENIGKCRPLSRMVGRAFLAVTDANYGNVIARYEAIWFQADYAT
jgi:hypothetical protein